MQSPIRWCFAHLQHSQEYEEPSIAFPKGEGCSTSVLCCGDWEANKRLIVHFSTERHWQVDGNCGFGVRNSTHTHWWENYFQQYSSSEQIPFAQTWKKNVLMIEQHLPQPPPQSTTDGLDTGVMPLFCSRRGCVFTLFVLTEGRQSRGEQAPAGSSVLSLLRRQEAVHRRCKYPTHLSPVSEAELK